MGNRRRIRSDQVRVGMHVVQLDRPWLETPFLFQGFTVRNLEEIAQLRRLCDYVFIDEESPATPPKPARRPEIKGTEVSVSSTVRQRIVGVRDYGPGRSLEAELEPASLAYRGALQQVHRVFGDVRAGRIFDAASARKAVREVVASVMRNPSAMLWFAQLQNREAYTALHSVNVAVYAVALGRHLGCAEEALGELGLAALLHDIGKLKIPLAILRKPGPLSAREFEVMKRHTRLGSEILRASSDLPPAAITVALRHHEALDGSGYPDAMKGEHIEFLSRLVAVVDRYDAMTSDRYYRDGVSPQEALKTLYGLRERVVDSELVSEFIRCMGVYPVGTLVELSSGEVGIVIGANPQRRLRPKVLVILNDSKRPQLPERIVDLAHPRRDELAAAYAVARALDPHSYGIDPNRHIRGFRSSRLQVPPR